MSSNVNATPCVTDSLHGVTVPDPFRWLEDRRSPATEQWIAGQRQRFDAYFLGLGPLDGLKRRVRELLDVETVDQAAKVRNRYFYRKRLRGQEQSSIFVKEAGDSSERLLISPGDEGPYASVAIHRISPDARLLAYEFKYGGEHTKSIRLIDVNSGSVLSDRLDRGLARGFAFAHMGRGFYYCHDSVAGASLSGRDHEVRFHRFGTPAVDDRVLLRLPRTAQSKLLLISSDQMLAAIYFHARERAGMNLYTAQQGRHEAWARVGADFTAASIPFLYQGRLFVRRIADRAGGEIVELDATSGLPLRVIVPPWRAAIHEHAAAGNRFFVQYLLDHASSAVRVWSLEGEFLGVLPLEDRYSWRIFPGFADDSDELFLRCESFTSPPVLISSQILAGRSVIWNRRQVPNAGASLTVRRLRYRSSDGAEIAMSLVGREDRVREGCRPVIMTAYGGFGAITRPRFSPFVSALLELGFLFALPEIRGGGERGRAWHESARGRNRPRAFADFIAAAEWLCARGFADPAKLAVFGGSHSGTLVGAVITQRPDLFRAGLCIAPLLDMVRYHLFDRARTWASEYGTAENAEDFRALLGYSPYHRIAEDVNYPAVLFVCGDQDTRCNPAHARKMAARLQERNAQTRAILLDHSPERGHAPTMPLSARIDALTQRIAFLCSETGVPIAPGG